MYLKEFFSSLSGKYIDVDGVGSATNKYQCVDVIKAYCNRVFDVPVSKMAGYGDAWEYYNYFSSKKAITPYFYKMAYKSGFKFKAGDIVVWKKDFGSTGAGHIAVATGKYTTSTVETFDQNFPSKSPCIFVTHTHNKINGVLRPKDFNRVIPNVENDNLIDPILWKNGKTKETVFQRNDLKDKIGIISAKETAYCYGKSLAGYVVVYDLDGTNKHKTGFVKYSGGVSDFDAVGKTYKNGKTSETVFADTTKKTKIGSLDINEVCVCLGKIDGMYLVLYNVNGTSAKKCGFVSYSGGVD